MNEPCYVTCGSMDDVVDEIQNRITEFQISMMPDIAPVTDWMDEVERIAEREHRLDMLHREVIKRKLEDQAKTVTRTFRTTKQRLKFNRARRGWR